MENSCEYVFPNLKCYPNFIIINYKISVVYVNSIALHHCFWIYFVKSSFSVCTQSAHLHNSRCIFTFLYNVEIILGFILELLVLIYGVEYWLKKFKSHGEIAEEVQSLLHFFA